MTQFIEFTLHDGSKVLVNVKKIIKIETFAEGSFITLATRKFFRRICYGLCVKESYDKIKEIMKFSLMENEHEIF